MPVRSTSLPGSSRPSSAASASASGIEPDEVLPYRSTLTTVFSSGTLQFPHSVVDDPDVRLVRDVDVDVVDRQVALARGSPRPS